MKYLFVAIAMLSLLGVSGGVSAGLIERYEVKIQESQNRFYGDMVATRMSKDKKQQLYCTTVATLKSERMSCKAYDSKGNHVYCVSTNPRLVRLVAGLHGDSYISVRYNDEGKCTWIAAYTSSTQLK